MSATTATRITTRHEKEYMTCSICGKYKGCWTDSGVCSDCDEAADERKIAENEEAEEGQQAQPRQLKMPILAAVNKHNGLLAFFTTCPTALDFKRYQIIELQPEQEKQRQHMLAAGKRVQVVYDQHGYLRLRASRPAIRRGRQVPFITVAAR